MKLHKNLVVGALDALQLIFNEGKQADKVLQRLLRRDKRWGARDRGFIAETTYDIVRWKRLYSEIAEVKEPFSQSDLFRLFAVWATLKGIALPPWPEFQNTPTRKIKGRFDELSKIRKIRESIPDWLDELGEAQLGERWEREIAALNQVADVILRVNTLKVSVAQLRYDLEDNNIKTEPIRGYPSALRLLERQNVFSTEAFKKGWFEVQDASSQLVAPLLDPKPGMRIVDACAGAGGKALHLATLMENKGSVIALDIFGNKLQELKRRARRNGVHNIEIREITSNKIIKKLIDKADAVLLDVPCTGLGVLRRNPDAKWKIDPERMQNLINTQKEILSSYSRMVRSGGKLVYATCSIFPLENEDQVKEFLNSEAGKEFSLVTEEKISPHESGFDGFYMALLKRQ